MSTSGFVSTNAGSLLTDARALLDAWPDHVAMLDAVGTIIAVSGDWSDGAVMVGKNYLAIAEKLVRLGPGDTDAVAEGLRRVRDGEVRQFSFDFHCAGAKGTDWCRLRVTKISADDGVALLVIHEDISDRKAAESLLQEGVQARDEELRRVQLLQQQLTDYLPDGVIYLASDGSLMGVNQQGAKSLHMSVEQLKTLKLADFAGMVSHEDGTPCPVQEYPASKCLATGQPQPPELIGVLQADGSRQWLLVTAVPAPCPLYPGRMGALATFLDLTDRKNVEEALRVARQDLELRVAERTVELQRANHLLSESEASFRQMAENIGEVIYIFNVETLRMLYISPTYEKVFGRPCAEIHEDWRSFTKTVEPEDLPRVMASLETRFHDPVDTVYRIRHGNGDLRWLRSRAFPLRNAEGTVYRVTGIVEDITDLQLAQEELSRLQQEVLAVTERERRRIGQDLHDGLGQHLTGIAFLSRSLQHRMESKAVGGGVVTEGEAVEAGKIAELVQSAIGQSRALARGLHPVEPVPTGLMSALHELAARTEALFRLSCSFECHCRVLVSDDAAANNLYRVAQEAVNNAVKHSGAKAIRISIDCADGQTVLAIADDGSGIPQRAAQDGGMGLRIMRYRAEMIGGSLSISRGERGGTVVRCVLPVGIQCEKEEE